MKCQRCNGAGKYKNAFGDIVRCDICYGTGKVEYGENDRLLPIGEIKRQTNDQWFSGLNTFEKAKWFCDHITCSDGCPFYKQCLDEDMGRELWQKWLLEEHRER